MRDSAKQSSETIPERRRNRHRAGGRTDLGDADERLPAVAFRVLVDVAPTVNGDPQEQVGEGEIRNQLPVAGEAV